jgi:hypothetical protein
VAAGLALDLARDAPARDRDRFERGPARLKLVAQPEPIRQAGLRIDVEQRDALALRRPGER